MRDSFSTFDLGKLRFDIAGIEHSFNTLERANWFRSLNLYGSSYQRSMAMNDIICLPVFVFTRNFGKILFGRILGVSIYTLSDLGVLSNLIGWVSLANEHYSLPTEWFMRKPNKNKMAGVNSRFASVSNRFLMVSFWKCCWDHWVCIY